MYNNNNSPRSSSADRNAQAPAMNRHQRRAQAAIARKVAAAAAAKAEQEAAAQQHSADVVTAADETAGHGHVDVVDATQPGDVESRAAIRTARQRERKAAFQAALRRGLLAMMTEYAQDRYGAWWIAGLDKILRNRIHDGFAMMEPDLLALGIIRDAAGGWWRWPASAPEPVFDLDAKFTRVIPRTPVGRAQPSPSEPDNNNKNKDKDKGNNATVVGSSKQEAIKRAVKAARDADNVAFKTALRGALKALMTDYCQERFGGAWWLTNLDDTLRRRLRAHYNGKRRVDFDLLDIKCLRDACHGWWTWPEGATEPVFSEDTPRAKPAESTSSSSSTPAKRTALVDADNNNNKPKTEPTKNDVAHARPIPSDTTRRKHARLQHKQRPAGAAVRARPSVA